MNMAILPNWKYLLLGFILFRAFDIWKPFPARQAESLPGGLESIMADDWIAGSLRGAWDSGSPGRWALRATVHKVLWVAASAATSKSRTNWGFSPEVLSSVNQNFFAIIEV